MIPPNMDSLPNHLRDEILFRMDIKSLAVMRCTNTSFYSLISLDTYFQSKYYSRFRSGLLTISVHGSKMPRYHSLGDSRTPRMVKTLKKCRILGSFSGLLLLSFDVLCLVNPLTKTFRFLNQHSSKFFLSDLGPVRGNITKYMGLAVHQTEQNSNKQSFKIVCMAELIYPDKTTYKFEINGGDSWRFSKTMITCTPSDLDTRMRIPIYLDGSLHWLRKDGSIIAFNPETEEALLIPTKYPQELSLNSLFVVGDNSLTLISATEEVIDVYALEKILINPKWVLVRQIPNKVINGKKLTQWNVEAYDGKCLVIEQTMGRELHGYNLRAKKWEHMGLIPGWSDAYVEFFQYSPSLSSVIGLDAQILSRYKEHMSALNSIIELVTDEFYEDKRPNNKRRKISMAEDNVKF